MLVLWLALNGRPALPDDPLAFFDLAPFRDRPIRQLSAGQKRRLALTRLLLSHAPLWLLDEPTTALDARSEQLFFDLLARHRAEGGMAIMASHDPETLPDAQTLALA